MAQGEGVREEGVGPETGGETQVRWAEEKHLLQTDAFSGGERS